MISTPPLWRHLQLLQPTLPLFAGQNYSVAKITTEHAAAAPRHMSYSFVVVPPPAPAATPAFEAHISTLLRHVPHPTFITCTSYSPYFISAAAESLAAVADTADESANATEVSATQQALSYLHQCVAADVGLVLTVTATRATRHAESVQSTQGGNRDSQQHPKQHTSSSSVSTERTTTTATLTGASRGGTAAVLADFIGRTSTAPATELGPAARHRSRGLMVLRGDDGGYTRQRMIAAQKDGASASVPSPSPSPNPYVNFADGVDFLGFVHSTLRSRDSEAMPKIAGGESAGAAVCLCVGGYPQGHVLDRQWGAAQEGADAATAAAVPSAQSSSPRQTLASLRFLDEVDTVFADTEAQLRRAQGTHSDPRPPSLESCVEAAEALFTRLGAVRRLWTTPSYYPPSVRAACTRRTVADKAFLRPPGTRQCIANGAWDGCGSAGARVVVTQMITSATEFFDYVEDIRSALRSSAPPARGVLCNHDRDGAAAAAAEARGASVPCLQSKAASALPSSSPSLVVVPGLMAPLRGEQFLRSTLQLKVIPSAPFRRALREYEGALHTAVETLRSVVSSHAIDAYVEAKERAETDFQERMAAITVDIVRDLRARGYTHVNFSAFQYGCGDAVGRVVAALAAEGGEVVVEQP